MRRESKESCLRHNKPLQMQLIVKKSTYPWKVNMIRPTNKDKISWTN